MEEEPMTARLNAYYERRRSLNPSRLTIKEVDNKY